MKLTRLAALVAVPAALSLAACSGGSSGVFGNGIATGGQQSNIRIVNGSPDLGSNIDVYLQATGAASPSAPAAPSTTNMAYGESSQFFQEAPVAYSVIVRAAGSSSTSAALAGLACPIPQLANNAKYTVVIAGNAGIAHTCRLFQDFDYGSGAQYRVHHAAASLGATIDYGVTNGTTPAAFNPSNVAGLGASVLTSGATYTPVQPAGPIPNPASDPVFVIGTTTTGANINATDTLDAKSLFASGSVSQPNTAGSLNFPSTAGTSLFAIDCTPAAVATLRGVQCNAGAALVGTFDTL